VLKTLQAGRALAAICVAAFHLSIDMGLQRYGGNAVFQEYTKHGHLGVDFFFVLSGFIILFAHTNDIGNPRAWASYAYKRFVRVFPIYWLYTTVFVLLLAFGFGTDAKSPGSMGDWFTTLTLIRFTSAPMPLGPAWTLFHEIAFYVTFSLLILSKRVGVIAFIFSALIEILLYHYPEVTDRTAFNVYTSAYGLYFLCGMGAFWLYKRGGRGILESVTGLGILMVAAVTFPLPEHLSSIIIAFGFAMVLAGVTKLEMSGHLKIPMFLYFIGDASYTIYLVHESLEGLLLRISMKTHLYELIGANATYVCVLAGTLAVGCAAYLVVERPLLAILRRLHGIHARQLPSVIALAD
jgi:exopolysaccharide production protein ExoZ